MDSKIVLPTTWALLPLVPPLRGRLYNTDLFNLQQSRQCKEENQFHTQPCTLVKTTVRVEIIFCKHRNIDANETKANALPTPPKSCKANSPTKHQKAEQDRCKPRRLRLLQDSSAPKQLENVLHKRTRQNKTHQDRVTDGALQSYTFSSPVHIRLCLFFQQKACYNYKCEREQAAVHFGRCRLGRVGAPSAKNISSQSDTWNCFGGSNSLGDGR